MKIIDLLIFTFENPEDIKYFISILQKLAEQANHVYKLVKTELGPIIQKIKSLKIEEEYLRDQQQRCKRALASAETKARTLVNNVQTLFDYADLEEDKAQSMKESFKSGTSRIVNYTEQIKRYVKRSQKSYQEFQTKYDEGIEICREVAAKCEIKSNEAKGLKVISGAAGGVAGGASGVAAVAAGAAGAGITAAVVAGPATLGVATITGLTVAAGTGVVAVGAAATSLAIGTALALKYEKLQKSFDEIIEDLENITNDFDQLSSHMEHLNEMLEITSNKTDDVEDHLIKDFDDFCVVFDILLKGVQSAHQVLKQDYL